MKIALLCPTRERVKDVKRLIESLLATTNNLENITLYLGIDDDDPSDYSNDSDFIKIVNIPSTGSFIGLGKIWNLMVKEAPEDILAMIGDDMVFETKDWDIAILNEFKKKKDNVLMVHCNDGMRGVGNPYPNIKPLAVNSFIHRLYYETFGYYVREEWKHGYHDTWLHDVFDKVNRRVYNHNIKINHLHVSNPNAESKGDAISARLSEGFHSISNPQQVYNNLQNVRNVEAKRLQEIIDNKGIPKLSLLICTLFNRDALFQKLLAKLREQENNDIEIHYEIDDGKMSIGEKRNKLLVKASGKYIAFIDDDDMVSDNYVKLILNAINKSNPDVIGLHLLMTIDGQNEERTYHSLKYDHWYDESDPDREGRRRYFRNPNHLNPVKREHALKVKFPAIDVGEDRDYSKKLLQYLKTEEYIEQPIYYYAYRSNK